MDPVDEIFKKYHIPGPWGPLPATGIANHIYATKDVVLRIAADHAESVPDARTESVAAPVARAAGVKTPELIAFDDTRELVDKPFSLWERVHGETLGLIEEKPGAMPDTWRQAGEELAKLHTRVTECPDPNKYLDMPAREPISGKFLKRIRDTGRISPEEFKRVEEFIAELRPQLPDIKEMRFLHYDLHAMNIMCTKKGDLLALLDWGDAGWGDPVLDFFIMEMEAIPYVLEGYKEDAAELLGYGPEKRIVWGQLAGRLWQVGEGRDVALGLDELKKILNEGL